jgi:hypothetical protein
VVQILSFLSERFSAVKHLTLEYGDPNSWSYEDRNGFDRTKWRRLLRSFGNMNTHHVDSWLVENLSRCLRSNDGEHPLELLPEPQVLRYSGNCLASGDAFTPFTDARQGAGRPVTLVHPIPRPVTLLFRTSSRSSSSSGRRGRE